MRRTTISRFALLMFLVCMPASGALLYDMTSFDFHHQQYEVSFTEPDFLSSTTTISTPDLNIIKQAADCTITSVTISNPFSGSPQETDCTGIVGIPGPLNHVGTFSNGAQLPTIVTISGTVSSTVPEPSLSWVLLPLAAAVLIAKKRVGYAPNTRA